MGYFFVSGKILISKSEPKTVLVHVKHCVVLLEGKRAHDPFLVLDDWYDADIFSIFLTIFEHFFLAEVKLSIAYSKFDAKRLMQILFDMLTAIVHHTFTFVFVTDVEVCHITEIFKKNVHLLAKS